jgi:hypothetical protein
VASALPYPPEEEIAGLALRVDDGASGANTAWELAQAFVLTDEERRGPAGLVRDVFHYGESFRRSRAKDFFVPMMEGDEFCCPPHIWHVTFDWRIEAGPSSFTARLSGILNTTTGAVVMDGTVVTGYLLGARVHEEGQLIDPTDLEFAGSIRIEPATAS